MKNTDNIGNNIFIKFDTNLDEIDNFLMSRFGIVIHWLFENGVYFEYPDTLITKKYPGDISFYESSTGMLVLTYLENFGALEFLNGKEEVILSIPLEEVKI